MFSSDRNMLPASSPQLRWFRIFIPLTLLFVTLFFIWQVAFAMPSLIIDVSTSTATVDPGDEIIFTIRYRCASLTDHCINPVITNTLPVNFQIDAYSGPSGLVDSVSEASGQITWNLQTNGSPAGQLDAGSTGLLFVRGRFPACEGTGATAGAYNSNVAFLADMAAGTGTDSVAFTLSSTVPPCPTSSSSPGGLEKESGLSPDVAVINGYYEFSFTFPSNGTAYTITEDIPDEMVVNSFLTVSTAGVTTQINCGDTANWYTATSNARVDSVGEYDVAWTDCVTMANPLDTDAIISNVTALRYIVQAGNTDSLTDGIRVYLFDSNPFSGAELPNWQAPVEGQDIVNCLVSSDVGLGSDCDTVSMLGEGPLVRLEKEIMGYPDPTDIDGDNILDFPLGGTDTGWPSDAELLTYFNDANAFPPRTQGSSDIIYGIEAATAEQSREWVDPIIVDFLDPNLEWVPYPEGNSWWFVVSADDVGSYNNPPEDPDCATPTFSYEEDYNGTGQTMLRWDFTGCTLKAGNTSRSQLWIFFSTRIKSGTPGTTVINNMAMTAVDGLAGTFECREGNTHNSASNNYWPGDYDVDDFDNDGITDEPVCKGRVESFTVPTIGDMESSKWVQGVLDTEFSRYPLIGSTNLTGTGTYELYIHNTGNTNVTQIDVVDILPHVGDTDVLGVLGARNSAWAMQLSGDITVERSADGTTWSAVPDSDLNTVGAMYAVSTNPCRFDGSNNMDANGTLPAACTSLSSGTAAVGATSFGFSFQPASNFVADEWLRITVPIEVSGNPPGCDDPLCDGDVLDTNAVAWNSFAYGGIYDDGMGGARFLDTEPIQVGLQMVDTTTQTSLGNCVWYDANNNGLQDLYEAPLSGVTVSLYESDGTTLIAQTLTDSSCFYRFNGLTPSSSYVIRLDNPADFNGGPLTGLTLTTANVNANANDTTDSDATYDGSTPTITAVVGAVTGADDPADPSEYPTNDFGFWQPASLGDTIWYDDDGFGDQTIGESGVENVVVNIYSVDGTFVDTDTTDANGYYYFNDLVPGYYYVDVDESTLPAGYKFTSQNSTGDDSNDSDADSAGTMAVTLLDPGENDPNWDAGIMLEPVNPAEIGNFVWLDENADGFQDGSEPGVEGVTVLLLDSNGILVSSTTTDSDGEYLFTGLTPGDYQVIVYPPSGYTFTTQDDTITADDTSDSDVDPTTGEMIVTTLIASESDLTWDAGLISSFDWGDLPDTNGASTSYPTNSTNLGEGVGASHVILGDASDGTPDGAGAIWLGTIVDVEGNGQPDAGASNDGADEDGVVVNLADWDDGPNGGQVCVTVAGGAGYVVGWFDFDGDGSFDTVIEQSVAVGSTCINVDVPNGTFLTDGTPGGSNLNIYARFRLFESQTDAQNVAGGTIDTAHGFTGIGYNGEVEDYVWTFTPTAVQLQSIQTAPNTAYPLWIIAILVLLSAASSAVIVNRKSRLLKK